MLLARELGLGVALASSGSPEKIRHNLRLSGLEDLFEDQSLIVSASQVKRVRESPREPIGFFSEVLVFFSLNSILGQRPTDSMFGGSDMQGKPSPDVYLEALSRLGVEDASRVLVVEDAVNGGWVPAPEVEEAKHS